ncbi:hypothetical protein ACFL6U_25050 [Planctomycetota bacterium]
MKRPQRFIKHKSCMLVLVSGALLSSAQPFHYENPTDYPLMGDWAGRWIEPKAGHEKAHPRMAAQLLPAKEGTFLAKGLR